MKGNKKVVFTLVQTENIEEIEADKACWNELLATDTSQTLLEKLAGEALAEHRAGKTRPMTFTKYERPKFL